MAEIGAPCSSDDPPRLEGASGPVAGWPVSGCSRLCATAAVHDSPASRRPAARSRHHSHTGARLQGVQDRGSGPDAPGTCARLADRGRASARQVTAVSTSPRPDWLERRASGDGYFHLGDPDAAPAPGWVRRLERILDRRQRASPVESAVRQTATVPLPPPTWPPRSPPTSRCASAATGSPAGAASRSASNCTTPATRARGDRGAGHPDGLQQHPHRTGRSTKRTRCPRSHDPYIGRDAGYLQVTRLSGHGPALLVVPLGDTPFEAYNPLLERPDPPRRHLRRVPRVGGAQPRLRGGRVERRRSLESADLGHAGPGRQAARTVSSSSWPTKSARSSPPCLRAAGRSPWGCPATWCRWTSRRGCSSGTQAGVQSLEVEPAGRAHHHALPGAGRGARNGSRRPGRVRLARLRRARAVVGARAPDRHVRGRAGADHPLQGHQAGRRDGC